MKSVITAAILIILMTVATSKVAAQTVSQSQELDQNVNVNCTASAYGQSNCTVNASQSGRQNQVITLANGQTIAAHQPVSAGVDVRVLASVGGLLATGVTSLVASRKIN